MSDPNVEGSDKAVAEEQGERVWNQWAPTDAEAVTAREAAEARAAEGTQTLPASAEDEVLSVDEAREEAKAKAEAQAKQRQAEREAQQAERNAEIEQRKDAKKTQK